MKLQSQGFKEKSEEIGQLVDNLQIIDNLTRYRQYSHEKTFDETKYHEEMMKIQMKLGYLNKKTLFRHKIRVLSEEILKHKNIH